MNHKISSKIFIFRLSYLNTFMYKIMRVINWCKENIQLFLRKNMQLLIANSIFFFKNNYVFSLHQLIPLIILYIKVLR